MLSELHSLNLKLCSKQYDKKLVLHLIVASHLGGGRRHNYLTKTRQAGCANEQFMYSLMSMCLIHVVLLPIDVVLSHSKQKAKSTISVLGITFYIKTKRHQRKTDRALSTCTACTGCKKWLSQWPLLGQSDYTVSESLASDKHYCSLDLFISYKESLILLSDFPVV